MAALGEATHRAALAVAGVVLLLLAVPLAQAQTWMGFSPASNHAELFNRCDSSAISGTYYCQQIQSFMAPTSPSAAIKAAAWVRAIDRGAGHTAGGHSIGLLAECDSWASGGSMPGWYCLGIESRIINKVDGAATLFGVKGQLSKNTGTIQGLYLLDGGIEENTGTIAKAVGLRIHATSTGTLSQWLGVDIETPYGASYATGMRIGSGYNVSLDVHSPVRIRSQDGSDDAYISLEGGNLYLTVGGTAKRFVLED